MEYDNLPLEWIILVFVLLVSAIYGLINFWSSPSSITRDDVSTGLKNEINSSTDLNSTIDDKRVNLKRPCLCFVLKYFDIGYERLYHMCTGLSKHHNIWMKYCAFIREFIF